MHIVFITTELSGLNKASGGLASFTTNMAKIFQERGHKVTVILSTVKEDDVVTPGLRIIKKYVPLHIWRLSNFISKYLGYGNQTKRNQIRFCLNDMYRSVQVRWELIRIKRNEPIDMVHYCNLANLHHFAPKNIPYVVRMSSYDYVTGRYRAEKYVEHIDDEKYLYKEILQDKLLKKTKYIVSPSKNIADELTKKLSCNVTVIESPFVGVGESYDYEVYNQNVKDKKYILFFGRLTYIKGITTLVEVIKDILNRYDDYYFVIAGSDEPKLLIDGKIPSVWMKEKLKIFADRVVMLGGVLQGQLYPIIEKAELVFLPYRYENFSNACLESMALGKIVVGTDGSSFEQLINDGINGFLCERDNPKNYSARIDDVLRMDEIERNGIAMNAKKTTQRLKPDAIYNQYFDFYRSVIDNWK